MNMTIHPVNCQCMECQAWFGAMNDGKVSGLCKCKKPIDDHPKDNKGLVQSCG